MTLAIGRLIKGHPIEAFFAIAILLSSGLLFPAIFLPQDNTANQILTFYLARLGAYSPVIAGIFVSSICQPDRQKAPFLRRMIFFLPAWLIALVVHTADLKLSAPADVDLIALIMISVPVACLPAYVISSALVGTRASRVMLSTLVKPKGAFVYYLVALLTFPVIHVVGVGITNALRGDGMYPELQVSASLAITVFVTFFSVLFFSGGINEESGWRGFAQTRLQQRYSPLTANLILWGFLLVWHIPNDLIQYQEGGYLMVRIGLYPFITILFGWVYNRTNGSILAPAIFHASMNTMNPLGDVFPITVAGNVLLVAITLGVIMLDRMWRPTQIKNQGSRLLE